jgi:hypothetical protein
MFAAAKQFQAPETRKYSQAQAIKLLDAAPELAAFAMQRARAPEIRLAPKPFNYQRRRKSRVACDGRPGFRRDNSADGPPINSPYSREIICRALSLGNGQAGLAATSRGDFPSSARNQFEKLNLAIVLLCYKNMIHCFCCERHINESARRTTETARCISR